MGSILYQANFARLNPVLKSSIPNCDPSTPIGVLDKLQEEVSFKSIFVSEPSKSSTYTVATLSNPEFFGVPECK